MGYIEGAVPGIISYSLEFDRVDSLTSLDGDLQIEPTDDLELPASINFTPCDFVDFQETHWELTSPEPTSISVEITDCDDCTTGTTTFWHEATEYVILLPSTPVIAAFEAALTGAPRESLDIITEYYRDKSDHRGQLSTFRRECHLLLEFEHYLETVVALSRESSTFDSVEYRNRYDHFSGAIRPDTPNSVESLDELKDRVERYNESPELSNVKVPDILTQYLADNQNREARDRIRRLGYEPEKYDPEYETPLPAGWIAHLYLTDGFRDSEAFARDRPLVSGSYVRQKRLAGDAEYGQRGAAWGKLIANAARESLEEYREVSANMLHWTATESRTDAAFHPMLHLVAKLLVEDSKYTRLHQRAAVAEQISLGHVNRRDHAWQESLSAFEQAHKLATEDAGFGYTRLVRKELEAVESIGIAADQLHRANGDIDEAIAALDEAITEIRSLDIVYERAREDALTLLRAKRYESIGKRESTNGNTNRARSALEDAKHEYEKVDKVRSIDRVESRLDQL